MKPTTAALLLLAFSLAPVGCASSRTADVSAPADTQASADAPRTSWETWPPPGVAGASGVRAPSDGPTVRVEPKAGGYTVGELLDLASQATGRPFLVDATMATFKQAKVDFVGRAEVRASDYFAFVQSVLASRKLVLVPVGPRLASGDQMWRILDEADPALKSRPTFLDESEVLDYADRDGLYVVTTLRLRDTVEPTRARNALSPLSTQTAGIGRIMDLGGRFLIVGDFAPVVAAMKRMLDRINAETSPSAVRPAPTPPAAPKADK